MKKLAMLAGAASLTLALSAFAGGPEVAPAAPACNWYVGVDGGVSVNANDSGIFATDTGWNIGGQLGYKYQQFKVELGLRYIRNTFKVNSNADQNVGLIMVNGLYNIPLGNQFSADIGGGIGYANYSINNNVLGASVSTDEFAYQGIVGLNYHLNDNMAIGLGYHIIGFSNPVASGQLWTNLFNATFSYCFS